MQFDEAVLKAFLENQGKLFDEKVAESMEEADSFLDEVCAVVCDDENEVVDYLYDEMDLSEYSRDEVLELEEVFKVGDGRYLVVFG